MNIELSREEIGQLLSFLNRVSLTPPEINTFIRLMNKIQQSQIPARSVPIEVKNDKKNTSKKR